LRLVARLLNKGQAGRQQDACTLYFVRHAQSSVNALASQPTEFDALGSSLTALGRVQAQTLAMNLAAVAFSAIFSSDLRRATETAQLIAGERPVQTIPRLRERYGYHPTEGEVEAPEAAVSRLQQALRKIDQQHRGKTVLVVSHGFVMRALLVALGYATWAELPGGAIEIPGISC
jgi:uncharacterized phosphatase